MLNETHRAPPRYKISDFFSSLLGFAGRDPKSTGDAVSLWRVDTTSNEIIKLTEGTFDSSPACSAHGRWVYYISPEGRKPQIQKVSIDGGTSKILSDLSGIMVFPQIDVSPDGRLLAFWTMMGTFGVINTETGKVDRKFPMDPRMGSSSGLATLLQFTADGKALTFTIHLNGVDNLWVQPLDGTPAYPITSFKSDEITDFHWSPSGDRLGIVRGRTESNVVLIR